MRATVEVATQRRATTAAASSRSAGAQQIATPQSEQLSSLATAINQGSAVAAQRALQENANQRPIVRHQLALGQTINRSSADARQDEASAEADRNAAAGANVQRLAFSSAGPPISPVVQRALNQQDAEALAAWLESQGLKKVESKYDNLVQQSASLAAAKATALDNASRARSGVAAGRLEANLKKYADPKTKVKPSAEQITVMQDILEVLAASQEGRLGAAVTGSIASLAREMMGEYPPDKNTYVLIGNSPAPLLAWLQLNGLGGAALHLPLGGLTTPEGEHKMAQVGKAGVQTKVSAYLDKTLGAAIKRGLPLLLVDYVSTGGSLVATANFVKAWLNEKGADLPVHVFGYSEHAPEEQAVAPLMKSGHQGILSTSVGRAEKAFTGLNARKLIKEALLLKGPASVDIVDLLNADDPMTAVVQHPEHWSRVEAMVRQMLS